jgi:hypothetical protein
VGSTLPPLRGGRPLQPIYPQSAKKKADEAIAAYDSAKASALALLPTIDTLPDVPSLAEVSGKISAALAEAGAKLNDAEAAALPKKK